MFFIRCIYSGTGVLGASKTCLHAVLDILNREVDTHRGPSCVTDAPKFTELAYQLVYNLCANKDTAIPTLRYLRTSHDFLYQHLQHLPFRNLANMNMGEGQPPVPMLTIVNQQSWLLKTAAIELRMTAQGRQRSHTQRLLTLLMGEPSAQTLMGMTHFPEVVPRRLEDDFTAADTSHGGYPGMGQTQTRRKLLAILESVEFCQDVPPLLQLNYFDMAVTEEAIASCEQKAEDGGVTLCNIPVLHKLLMSEIIGAQGTATAGQRNFLLQVSVVLSKVFTFLTLSFMLWKLGTEYFSVYSFMFNIFNSVAFSVFSLRIFVSAHVIVTSITALDVFTNPLWLVLLLYVFFFSFFFDCTNCSCVCLKKRKLKTFFIMSCCGTRYERVCTSRRKHLKLGDGL